MQEETQNPSADPAREASVPDPGAANPVEAEGLNNQDTAARDSAAASTPTDQGGRVRPERDDEAGGPILADRDGPGGLGESRRSGFAQHGGCRPLGEYAALRADRTGGRRRGGGRTRSRPLGRCGASQDG